MSEDNPGEGRKKARARQAQKRDQDVLEGDDAGEDAEADAQQPIQTPDDTATARGDDQLQAPDQPETEGDDREPEELTTQPVNPAARGEEWLHGLFDRMNLDLEAEGSFQKPNYVFNISGADADDLIGRSRSSPKLMSAMQTLLREHLGDDIEGDVLVDVGGFKEKRRSQLVGVADQLGETVRRIGRSMTVAGLDKYERRIIHQRLADVDGVDTDSVGDGVFRKLRVLAR